MPLNLQGIDPEKCAQRNRLAATRYGVEAAPLRFSPEAKVKPEFSRGHLPTGLADHMERINALIPEGGTLLTPEDVYILPTMESANTNFVGDRYLFLGSTTLRNIQREAERGFAFMNSHRTGDVSTPSELPFGRTYAGRYERFASTDGLSAPFERTQLSVYMLRGVYPNGANGPSSDDLYRQITGGVINDVSMGLNGGQKMCDVCGYELRTEGCTHLPGTNHSVTKEQSQTQKARGVNKGYASYTLNDAHAGEVSSVYDGAIPGAGFSKVMEAIKLGRLSQSELQQVQQAYGTLLRKGELGIMHEQYEEVSDSLADKIVARLGGIFPGLRHDAPIMALSPEPKFEETQEAVLPEIVTAPPAARTLIVNAEVERLQKQIAERDEKLARIESDRRTALARDVANEFLNDKQLLPAGVPAAEMLATLLSNVGEPMPESVEYTTPLGQPKRVTPVQLLRDVFAEVPQHDLLTDHELTKLPDGSAILAASVPGESNEEAKALEDVERFLKNSNKRNEKKPNA